MKDPLSGETRYEVLGVDQGADEGTITRAFATLLPRGNVGTLTAARQRLVRPTERALEDLLHYYDDDTLRALSPSALDDPSVLSEPRRAATAIEWEEALRARFPDPDVAHCLALLWMWSAEARGAAEGGDVGPATSEIWEAALGYWASIIADEAFLERRFASEVGAQVGTRLESHIRGRLDELPRAHAASGSAWSSERYRQLELGFDQELRTARAAATSDIRTARGPVCAGPTVLTRLGLLEDVIREVEEALAARPGDESLRTLRDGLSPWGRVAGLIDSGRGREALESLAALPDDVRESADVADLHARALVVEARQTADLGDTDAALQKLATALATARGSAASDAVREEIVTLCRGRAAALASERREEAIALLERGLELVDDGGVRSTLAEHLAIRGVETLREAQEQVGSDGITKAIRATFDRGVADLERAKTLGSTTAAQQLDAARGMLEQVAVGDDVREANEAAERGEWDRAVSGFRKAVDALGDEAPPDLRRSLAVSLANRASKPAEQAVELLGRTSQPNLASALAIVQADERRAANERRRAERWKPRRLRLYAVVVAALVGLWFLFFLRIVPHDWLLRLPWPSNATIRRALEATGGVLAIAVVGFWVLSMFVIPIVSGIAKWFTETVAPIRPYSGYSTPARDVPKCDVCGTSASYEVPLAPDDPFGASRKTPLCYTHAQALERAAQQAATSANPLVADTASAMLNDARRDLEEAAVLAPDLKGVREGIAQLDEVSKRYGLAASAFAAPADGTSSRSRRSTKTQAPRTAAPKTSPSAPADPGEKVNLNTAPAGRLAQLPGIGPALARRIVLYREAYGPLKSPWDLKRVDGMGDTLINRLLPLVTVGENERWLP